MEKQIFACCLRGMRKNDGSGSVSPCPEGLKIIKCCFLGADPPLFKSDNVQCFDDFWYKITYRGGSIIDWFEPFFDSLCNVGFKKGVLHPRTNI